MKNLELENYGVQEMRAGEMSETDGGNGIHSAGSGVAMDSAGVGSFYAGVVYGFYKYFFK